MQGLPARTGSQGATAGIAHNEHGHGGNRGRYAISDVRRQVVIAFQVE